MLSRAVARELGVQGVAVLRGAAPFVGARLGARNLVVPGDVILAVEGKSVTTAAQLAAILDDYRPGNEVGVDVWREGKRVQLKAKLRAAGAASP